MSTSRVPALIATVLLLTACERAKQIQEVKRDEKVLAGATEAINQVVHDAGNCDAVKAALPEAKQRLNEAIGAVQEPGSRETLQMLGAQLQRAESACP